MCTILVCHGYNFGCEICEIKDEEILWVNSVLKVEIRAHRESKGETRTVSDEFSGSYCATLTIVGRGRKDSDHVVDFLMPIMKNTTQSLKIIDLLEQRIEVEALKIFNKNLRNLICISFLFRPKPAFFLW